MSEVGLKQQTSFSDWTIRFNVLLASRRSWSVCRAIVCIGFDSIRFNVLCTHQVFLFCSLYNCLRVDVDFSRFNGLHAMPQVLPLGLVCNCLRTRSLFAFLLWMRLVIVGLACLIVCSAGVSCIFLMPRRL